MDGLKQRIIGALVLVCLAVIFVPMIFDEPHSERTSSSVRIPEEPPFPEVDVSESDYAEAPAYRIEEQTGAATENTSPVPDSRIEAPVQSEVTPRETQSPPEELSDRSEPASSEVAAPATREASPPATEEGGTSEPESAEFTRSLEGAWVVQLGSFGSADNARRLRDNARELGYSSHLQEVERGDSTLTRVFSGPFVDKQRAEAAKTALDKAFGINSLVTSGGN